MSDYIPDELLLEILERLPVTSLICFTSVCKSWYSLIRSPNFITAHLNRVTSPDHIVENEKIVVTPCVADEMMMGLYSLSGHNVYDKHLKLDLPTSFFNVEIVGTCSGLVCLGLTLENGFDRIIIWNPHIRKSVSILCPERTIRRQSLYGFCVHPTTLEYKVLALVCKNNNGIRYNVEIYRQHTGAWSVIDSAVPNLVDGARSRATVNGVVHWLVFDEREGIFPFHSSIASFNMHTETFSEMTLPPSIARMKPSDLNFGLAFCRESLVLFEMGRGTVDLSRSSIWVMKEYGNPESWTKLFNIEIPREWHRPLGLRMNGELLLSALPDRLVSHDPVTKRTTTVAIEGMVNQADTYVESLLLLNANGASEQEAFGEFLYNMC